MRSDYLQRYRERLQSIPPPAGGCHTALSGIANLGFQSGFDNLKNVRNCAIPTLEAEKIFQDIRYVIPERWYLRSTITSIDVIVQNNKTVLQNIINQGKISGEADLWETSPMGGS